MNEDDEEQADPPEVLRFYFGDRRRAEDPVALEAFVEGLADREWLVAPPTMVERGREVELRTCTFRSSFRHDDPEDDRRALADVRWLAEQLAELTRRLGREIELAIDEEPIGWVIRGEVDPELAGFLARWDRTLAGVDHEVHARGANASQATFRWRELVERAPDLAMAVVRSMLAIDDTEIRDVPEAASHAVHVLWGDSEIRNGGISQLVYNRGTAQAQRTADGLRAVGAPGAAFLLERAMDRIGDADPRNVSLHDLNLEYYRHDPSVRALLADYLGRRSERWFDELASSRDVRQRAAEVTIQDTLRQAIELGHSGRVRASLAAGASATAGRADGESPLFVALAQTDCASRVEVVAALLDAGASHADQDSLGQDALSVAASGDRPAFLRLLLDRGASPTKVDENGVTALHYARGADVCELLLAAGVDPRAVTKDGRTVLHRVSDFDQLRLLLDAGADPLGVTSGGESTLHQPLDEDSVRVLLELGVAADRADAEGRTPLMCQAWSEAMAVLLDAGARIDARDARGRTVLHRHHSSSCTELLLARGADPLLADVAGKSPLDEARERDYFGGRYVALLERAAGIEKPKAVPAPVPTPAPISPLFELAGALLERLTRDHRIEVAAGVDMGSLREELAEFLGGLAHHRDAGGEMSRWLLDREEVEEVFASDEDLRSVLEEVIGS